MDIITEFFEGYENCGWNCQQCDHIWSCWREKYQDFKKEVLSRCADLSIGDRVWIIKKDIGQVVECTITKIQNRTGKTMISVQSTVRYKPRPQSDYYQYYSHAYPVSSFGKSLFRTKEEAEKRLKK